LVEIPQSVYEEASFPESFEVRAAPGYLDVGRDVAVHPLGVRVRNHDPVLSQLEGPSYLPLPPSVGPGGVDRLRDARIEELPDDPAHLVLVGPRRLPVDERVKRLKRVPDRQELRVFGHHGVHGGAEADRLHPLRGGREDLVRDVCLPEEQDLPVGFGEAAFGGVEGVLAGGAGAGDVQREGRLLHDVEHVDDVLGAREVLVPDALVGVVHVGGEVPHRCPFLRRDRAEVGRHVGPLPRFHDVEEPRGRAVHEDERVAARAGPGVAELVDAEEGRQGVPRDVLEERVHRVDHVGRRDMILRGDVLDRHLPLEAQADHPVDHLGGLLLADDPADPRRERAVAAPAHHPAVADVDGLPDVRVDGGVHRPSARPVGDDVLGMAPGAFRGLPHLEVVIVAVGGFHRLVPIAEIIGVEPHPEQYVRIHLDLLILFLSDSSIKRSFFNADLSENC